jgi:hypothetical protein
MKILALIDVAPGAGVESIRAELVDELKGSWQLFSSGVLREAYATATPSRVVFVLEAADAADAERLLRQLPLIAGGMLRLEVIELRPFVNWSMLFAR